MKNANKKINLKINQKTRKETKKEVMKDSSLETITELIMSWPMLLQNKDKPKMKINQEESHKITGKSNIL